MGSNNTTRPMSIRRSTARDGVHRRRRLLLLGTIATVVALSACGGDDDASTSENAALDASGADEPASEPGDAYVVTAEEAPQTAGDTDNSGFDLGVVGREVIIEMQVTMSSDDIQRTVASITANASTLGGGVASSDVDFGDRSDPNGSQGYAVLVVKVPPESVDRLLSGLDSSGEVLRINQSAQDVTEQLVDLDVRIDNAAESVANVRKFMDQTENLSELVALEGELTRRQTELEQLEAQQRNLSDRVALSTVTIEVVPTSSVPEPVDDSNSIGDAFRNGWEAFTSFLFGIAYVLATLLPFLVVGAIGLVVISWLVRRYNGRPDDSRSAHDSSGPHDESVRSEPDLVSAGASVLPPPADETANPDG